MHPARRLFHLTNWSKADILFPAEDLPLAPGFTTTTTGYDPPSFYSSSNDQQSRIYDSSYREPELYPGEPPGGYRTQNSYSLYSSSTGLSVDLPSPDSGIGPDQVTSECASPLSCRDIIYDPLKRAISRIKWNIWRILHLPQFYQQIPPWVISFRISAQSVQCRTICWLSLYCELSHLLHIWMARPDSTTHNTSIREIWDLLEKTEWAGHASHDEAARIVNFWHPAVKFLQLKIQICLLVEIIINFAKVNISFLSPPAPHLMLIPENFSIALTCQNLCKFE